MGKTFKGRKPSSNHKKKYSKNRFVSVSFSLLWVVLFSICIYIYNISGSASIGDKDKAIMASTESHIEVVKQGTNEIESTKENSNSTVKNSSKEGHSNNTDNSSKESLENPLEELNDKSDTNTLESEKSNTEDKESNINVTNEKNNTNSNTNENVTSNNNTVEKTPKTQSKTSTNEEKVQSTSVNKVKFDPNNKVVVIDPGHANRSNHEKEPIAPGSSIMKIKDGGGATGQFSRTPEYVIAMEVSNKLKNILEARGFTIVMTKTDNSISLGNVERAEIGNNANAALVVRIHADSAGVASAHGASILLPSNNKYTEAIYDESKRCASIVLDAMVTEVGMYNRGLVYREDITGFNWSKVPVILVEMGFLSNEKEDKLLNTSEYQDKIAKGLADGIEKALTLEQ